MCQWQRNVLSSMAISTNFSAKLWQFRREVNIFSSGNAGARHFNVMEYTRTICSWQEELDLRSNVEGCCPSQRHFHPLVGGVNVRNFDVCTEWGLGFIDAIETRMQCFGVP